MLGLKKNLVSTFDYWYMILMVVYMGQLGYGTQRMVQSISGDLFPFLLPIVATIIFANKHRVTFNNRNLHRLLLLFGVWSVAVVIKKSLYSTQELSYYFFLFYAIIVAYVHVRGYGRKFFPCFEEVMVLFCKIAVIGWLICNLFPGLASSVMHQFPETKYGNHFFYIFHWMDPAKDQIYRNAGISWEPGRFAIMVIMAIVCNLQENGIKFRGNKNIVWLLFALATTLSTTGYVTAMAIFSLYWMKSFSAKYVIGYCVLLIPAFYMMSSLDFIGGKLKERVDVQDRMESAMVSIDYANSQGRDEYAVSLDRFESIGFELVYNIPNDPLLGYGVNVQNSYYSKNISQVFTLTGGLVKLFGQYGIPLGFLLYYILLLSSKKIAFDSKEKRPLAIMVAIMLASVSYIIFLRPIFMTFWLYGLFVDNENNDNIS